MPAHCMCSQRCSSWQCGGCSCAVAALGVLLRPLLPAPEPLLDCRSGRGGALDEELRWRCDFPPALDRPNGQWDRSYLQAWDAADARGLPSERPLLLYGSSILRLWEDAAASWAPLPALSRAFGGSRTWEALQHFGRAVARYRPRVIVFYCGSNDVNFHAGHFGFFGLWPRIFGYREAEAAREIAGNVAAFIAAAGRLGAQVVVCSIINAPQKRISPVTEGLVRAANEAISVACESAEHAEFVDLNPFLEDESGRPLLSLYLPDGLHYKAEAYGRIHAALREPVMRRWALGASWEQG